MLKEAPVVNQETAAGQTICEMKKLAGDDRV